MKGFIVSADHTTLDENTYIQLFGKLQNGESFAILNKLTPYFFVKDSDLNLIKKHIILENVQKTNLRTFNAKKVTKLIFKNQTELNKIAKQIHKLEIDTFEADIKPHYRFIIDNNLLGTIEIEGDYQTSQKVNRVYREAQIKPTEYKPELKVASIDIESSKEHGGLYCIGISSKNYKKNFMITKKELGKDIISCKDEAECLEKFKQELIDFDPDIITGWHVIDFDLNYLKERFKKNKVSFDLGRNNDQSRIKIESGFFRPSSAKISGRQVLDGLNLIRDPFIKEAPSIKNAKFKSFTLEDVSQEILKTGKILKGKTRHDEITELYKKDQKKLAEYNIKDCELAYQILEKTKTIDLAIERTQLTGLTMDKLTASIAAFDSLYIRGARKRGFVSPTTRYTTKEERIKGGFVMESSPGIYNNVLVLDFKSLYPSIIKTFNIDPASQVSKKGKETLETPNNAHFINQEGILPEIIERLHLARERAKKEKRELASYAIKIIQNSFFGSLASPNCRYFNMDMANAITHFGQFLIKLTAKEIEKTGYKVLYSDTDSTFVETNLDKEEANKLGEKIEKEITKFYDNYTKKNYNRKSYLELEFEKQYISLVIPKIRGSESTAAKKRYAGLVNKGRKEYLQVVGLEAIRGDWTLAAKNFQKELLLKVFHKKPVNTLIKNYVKEIKSGNKDKELIYKKSLRKPLDEYVKTTPPHVKAGRKLEKLESNIIEYYVTLDGPEPIQKLKHKIDYDHYIKKQIKPIADQILSLIGKDFDQVIATSKQSTLNF